MADLNPFPDILKHVGFPGGIFLAVGVLIFLSGVLTRNLQLIWGGAGLICLGFTCYYGQRMRWWMGYGGGDSESGWDLGATASFLVFMILTIVFAYLFTITFPVANSVLERLFR